MKNLIIMSTISLIAIIFTSCKRTYKVELYATTAENSVFKNYDNYSIGIKKNTTATITLTDGRPVISNAKDIPKDTFLLQEALNFKRIEFRREETSDEGYLGTYTFRSQDDFAVYVFNPQKSVQIWADDSTIFIK